MAKAGIPVRDAAALEHDLAAAEGKLPQQHVAMLSRFEGMLMMDPTPELVSFDTVLQLSSGEYQVKGEQSAG